MDKVCLFEQSCYILYQIQGESKTYKKFVQNQVVKVLKKFRIKHCVHIPGKQNPTDLPSPGRRKKELAEKNLSDTNIECLTTTVKPVPSLRGAINFERHGSLEKLLRIVSWCRRFIHNCRSVREKKSINDPDMSRKPIIGEMTAEEYHEAKFMVIRSMQGEMLWESGYKKRDVGCV